MSIWNRLARLEKSKESKAGQATLGSSFLGKGHFEGKTVVYNGKMYKGSHANGRILLTPVKGPFKSLRVRDITGKYHVVTIPENVYKRFKNVVPKGKLEAVGTLRGIWIGGEEREHLITSVKDIDMVPSSMTASEEKTLNPTGGTLLNPLMKRHIKDKAVGEWHSHPTRDRISPADKREFRNIVEDKELGSSAQVQLITRDKSIFPWGKKSRPAEPLAYYIPKEGGKIQSIPIILKKKS